MALVLITHDLALVAEAAHKIIVMYAGQVVETGAAQDIFRAPRHPYTRALLRALPEFAQDKARLASLPGVVPGNMTDRRVVCLTRAAPTPRTDVVRKNLLSTNWTMDVSQNVITHSMMPGGPHYEHA